MKACAIIATLVLVAGSLDTVAAQSFGEIARREVERRKQTTPGKQYTNADLREEPQPVSSASRPQPGAALASSAAPAPSASPAPAPTAAPVPEGDATPGRRGPEKRGETYWRTRARELRGRVQQLQEQVAALEGRVADLDAQLQAGASSAVGRERGVAANMLDRLRQDLRFLGEEVQRFEQSAGLDNVPAEWIR